MPRWDTDVDFAVLEAKLRRLVREAFERRIYKRAAYAATLLVALANGGRVSEARDALIKAIERHQTRVWVRVRKSRRKRERLFIIPSPPIKLRSELLPFLRRKNFTNSVWAFSRRWLGTNPHSLRYAYISLLSRQGVAPQIIAKITGHRRVDMVVEYTRQSLAEMIQRRVVEEFVVRKKHNKSK